MDEARLSNSLAAIPTPRAPQLSELTFRVHARAKRRVVALASVAAVLAFAVGLSVRPTDAPSSVSTTPATPTAERKGVTAEDGRPLLGPSVQGDDVKAENTLAVSLVVGLIRDVDGVTFGEYVKDKMEQECGPLDSADVRFTRLAVGQEDDFHIEARSEGCSAYIAKVDWRTAAVISPIETTSVRSSPRPWLDEFRAGAPLGAP